MPIGPEIVLQSNSYRRCGANPARTPGQRRVSPHLTAEPATSALRPPPVDWRARSIDTETSNSLDGKNEHATFRASNRRGDRVADGTRLLSERRETYRGFESRPLRKSLSIQSDPAA